MHINLFLLILPRKHLCSEVTCHNCVHACMQKAAQIPAQSAHKLQRGRAGLFLPDALCLKKKVLTDSRAPGPYSARVQCGCLANEVDYRDYNQTGNISVLMCQSAQEKPPAVATSGPSFSSFRSAHVYIQQHGAASQHPPGRLQSLTVTGRRSYGGKSQHGSSGWTRRAPRNAQIISCRLCWQ